MALLYIEHDQTAGHDFSLPLPLPLPLYILDTFLFVELLSFLRNKGTILKCEN